MKQMRAALILILILIFSSPNQGFGVPIESVPETDIHGSDPITPGIAPGPPLAKIPDSPVEMFIRQGPNSRFELFFLDVRYGYDLVDFEFYKAWCLAKNKPLRRNAIHKVRLYNCYAPYLPAEFNGMGWNRINYVINHKKGSKEDIQQAIWHITAGEKLTKPSVEATQLIEEANLKGKDYIPAAGELMAIICKPDGQKQPVFIEYKIPETILADIAPASFAPAADLAAASIPAWLPLLPVIPVIPFIPTGPNPPPGPPPPPPPPMIPEPSSLLLLTSVMAGILVSMTLRKRIKNPHR